MSDVIKVLRVGVSNNFNFTEKELEDIRALPWDQDKIFVNSNSFVTIKSDYPSFVTINPYLTEFVAPTGDISNIRACRIKYVSDAIPKVSNAFREALEWSLSNRIPVLVTFMRFIGRASMEKFVQPAGTLNYSFKSGYWRLKDINKRCAVEYIKSLVKLLRLDDALELIHYCDMAGDGCPVCGNCAKLAFNIDTDPFELYGINLSSSGDKGGCIFNCPDCWAKRIASFRKVSFDKITQNSKQKGYKLKEKVKEISKKLNKKG